MIKGLKLSLFSLLILSISSCVVSKKKYNELGQDYEDMERKLVKAQKQNKALKNEVKLKDAEMKLVKAEMKLVRDKTASVEEGLILDKTTVKFARYLKDFGDIKQESENVYTFYFTNTGKYPLFITSAEGSCGCTVPTYPTEPVKPGEKSSIKVVYSPGMQEGNQEKTITITGNLVKDKVELIVKANVLKKED